MSQHPWPEAFECRVAPDRHLLHVMWAMLWLGIAAVGGVLYAALAEHHWVRAVVVIGVSAWATVGAVISLRRYARTDTWLRLEADGKLLLNQRPVMLRTVHKVGSWRVWDLELAPRQRVGLVLTPGACGFEALHQVRLAGAWLLQRVSDAGRSPHGRGIHVG